MLNVQTPMIPAWRTMNAHCVACIAIVGFRGSSWNCIFKPPELMWQSTCCRSIMSSKRQCSQGSPVQSVTWILGLQSAPFSSAYLCLGPALHIQLAACRTDVAGAEPAFEQQPSLPDGIMNWKCGNLIGAGAFGRVYMGMNNDNGKLMAVKQVGQAPMPLMGQAPMALACSALHCGMHMQAMDICIQLRRLCQHEGSGQSNGRCI